MTKQEKIIKWFETPGNHHGRRTYKRINGSDKYTIFRDDQGNKWYIGKNGAVRKGKNLKDSVSLTFFFRKVMNLWDKQI